MNIGKNCTYYLFFNVNKIYFFYKCVWYLRQQKIAVTFSELVDNFPAKYYSSGPPRITRETYSVEFVMS